MKAKGTKKLVLGLLTITVCFAMLLGTTFAWFTDSVTSSNNIIKSGSLDVSMSWAKGTNNPETTNWKDASTGAIFNNDKWEPGYAEVRHIKIENIGTLAFKYRVDIVATDEVSDLADVIEVYYVDPAVQIASAEDLVASYKIGTLTQVLENMSETAYGVLAAGENHTVTIALKMMEEAGNEYQGKSIGTDFAITLHAAQMTAEEDSFGSDYDAGAKLPVVKKTVVATTPAEFKAELSNATVGTTIDATGVTVDLTDANHFTIPAGVTIKGATLNPTYRGGNYVMFTASESQEVVFENCNFNPGTSSRTLVLGGTPDGPTKVVYNNCTFAGQVITNFVDNPNGVAEFNNCKFTKASVGYSFVEGMGGTHIFNNCTFDYTGLSQSSMGVLNNACVNAYSESDGSYSTVVILNGCTRINCGTRQYGAKTTLTIK